MTTIRLSDTREVTLHNKLWEGGISDIFDATLCDEDSTVAVTKEVRTRYERIMDHAENRNSKSVIVRIAKQPYYNDLIERDIAALSKLHPEKGIKDRSFPKYYPTSYGGVLVDGKQGHILGRIENGVTLAEVLKAYPDGIDYRDVAWMLKRILVGLWFAHKREIIHGSIIPPHIVLTLHDHGGRLVDWAYSTEPRTKVPAMISAYEDYYPPEIPNSEPAREGTDLYMAIKCAQALLGGDLKTKEFPGSVPDPIRELFGLCLNESVHMRPIDVSEVHESFEKLMKDAVGKPTFRPFSMPGPT